MRRFSQSTYFFTAISFLLLLFAGLSLQAHDDAMPGKGRTPQFARENMRAFAEDHHHNEHLSAQSITTCTGGMAGGFPCENIDLMSFLPTSQIGGGNGNDVWGWTDPLDGKEYAIMGLTNGTAFVDISDPVNPVYLGHLPPHTGVGNSSWRDIKTYNNHAYIGSEALNSGMQVVDLTQLRSIASPPVTIVETAFYTGFSTSHNIVINEDSGYAYGVGLNSGNCGRGLHFVNILNPTSPQSAGCFNSDGYTHDAQCVIYNGPDTAYVGNEICFAYNEDTLTIVDVTNKGAPVQLSRTGYANRGYSHQGWITENHAHLLMDDELDERNITSITNTRTLVWNIEDLDNPFHQGDYEGVSTTIDHNQYIVGNYSYQANYQSGLRILDITDIANVTQGTANDHISEAGFFDVYTSGNATGFNGAWSVYPFFESGIVIVSGIEQGLFILRPNLGTPTNPPVTDLLDPADASEVSGNVAIRINATDIEDAPGTLTVEWNIDGGAWQPASYVGPDYEANWDSTTVFDGNRVITARAVDSDMQAHSDSHTVSVANGMQTFTADVIDVYVETGKGNRNRGFGTILVSDENGDPLENALVDSSFGGDWTGNFSSTSDANGLITVQTQKVKNLSYVELCVLNASVPGMEFNSTGSMLCRDNNSASTFGTVAGKVTDSATSNGITNASVETDTGQSTTTDSYGDYSIANVPTGSRTVSVTASGYDNQQATDLVTDGGTTTIDFALVETPTGGSGSVKGTVYSGQGGKLQGVTVTVDGGTSSMTNKGGKYTIQNVPGGWQTIIATKPGYLTQEQDVIVTVGGSVTLNFTLQPAGN